MLQAGEPICQVVGKRGVRHELRSIPTGVTIQIRELSERVVGEVHPLAGHRVPAILGLLGNAREPLEVVVGVAVQEVIRAINGRCQLRKCGCYKTNAFDDA